MFERLWLKLLRPTAVPVVSERREFPIPSGPEGAWLPHVRHLQEFTCEATFVIEPSFYIGPDNGIGELEWEAAKVVLPPVELPRQFPEWVTTAELLGREAALIEHYRGVVALAVEHGKLKSLSPFPYFRTKPALIAGDKLLTEFDWNDDIDETRTVLEALVDARAGTERLVHVDLDQGWEILIVASESNTCWIEWSGEGPPPQRGGYSVDRLEVATQALAAMERLQVIHSRLVEALGHDYWTYRPKPAQHPR